MSNKNIKEVSIQDLLDKEKAKNRRIIMTVLIIAAFVIGFITSYFIMRSELSNVQAEAISTYISVKK